MQEQIVNQIKWKREEKAREKREEIEAAMKKNVHRQVKINR